MTWLVAIDRPYYPSMTEFEDYEDAATCFMEIVATEFDEGGENEVRVYLTEIKQFSTITTHY